MWDGDVKYRSASGRTVDLHPPAQYLDTVFEPDEPGAFSRVGTADAVVGDRQAKAVDGVAEVVPGFVELEVAVPRLRPAVW
jgi:hypothetical protein